MYSLTKIIELNATINDRKLTIHKNGHEVAELENNCLKTRLSKIDDKHVRELLMLVYMTLYCTGCGMCSVACPGRS